MYVFAVLVSSANKIYCVYADNSPETSFMVEPWKRKVKYKLFHIAQVNSINLMLTVL